MGTVHSPGPMVSVIVPVYNGARTLGACLAALAAQSYGNYQVLVVDDGSTDATADIAGGYPCSLIRLGRNVGSARAKNHGAERAAGDILFFTDADCRVGRDALAHVVEDFGAPDVDGVVGLLANSCPHANYASQFKNLWMHFTYLRQPRRVGLFFTSAAAIRRDLFEQEGGFDPNYGGASITEDIEFGQRLLSAGRTIVMDKRLQVEHDKHYTVAQVLRTDLQRARGLIQTWVRNRVSGDHRAHYASVPWYFGAGVMAVGLATAALLLALVSGSRGGLVAAAALLAAAWALNAPFLAALGRWRGLGFGLVSAGFLVVDLFASGLGIVWGLGDFAIGKHY